MPFITYGKFKSAAGISGSQKNESAALIQHNALYGGVIELPADGVIRQEMNVLTVVPDGGNYLVDACTSIDRGQEGLSMPQTEALLCNYEHSKLRPLYGAVSFAYDSLVRMPLPFSLVDIAVVL